MDYQEIFSESVRKHFAYLIDEFDFSIVEDQYRQGSAACVVAFQNKTRYVQLIWDLRDAEFYFGVYRVLSNGKPAPYQDYGTNQFYISTLAELYENSRSNMRFLDEMDRENPDLLRLLDEKISANAQLLRKYGKDILAGRQWFDQIQNTLIPAATLTDGLNSSPPESDSRSIPTGQPIDSTKPLPMWMSLLIVGGISLCIGAALTVAFWLLVR